MKVHAGKVYTAWHSGTTGEKAEVDVTFFEDNGTPIDCEGGDMTMDEIVDIDVNGKVVVTVHRGIAEVSYAPDWVDVEIIDFDNMNREEAEEAEKKISMLKNNSEV